jgi:hypothetical protein
VGRPAGVRRRAFWVRIPEADFPSAPRTETHRPTPFDSVRGLARFTNQSHSRRLHRGAVEYRLEYRTVSEPCISQHLAAALNPHYFSTMQRHAARCSHLTRTSIPRSQVRDLPGPPSKSCEIARKPLRVRSAHPALPAPQHRRGDGTARLPIPQRTPNNRRSRRIDFGRFVKLYRTLGTA